MYGKSNQVRRTKKIERKNQRSMTKENVKHRLEKKAKKEAR